MSKIPTFANEQEEAEFWDTHDSTEYQDETSPVDMVFTDVRARTVQISLRLDPETISKLKTVANKRGIVYQTLIRMRLMDKLSQERP